MTCRSCGREKVPGSVFCTYCGARLDPDVSLGGHHLDDERKRLRDAVNARKSSDGTMPPWIVVIPLIIDVVAVIAVFAVVLAVLANYDIAAGEMPTESELQEEMSWIAPFGFAVNVIFYGFFAVIAYRLVDGANRHLRREAVFRQAVVDLIHKVGGRPQTAPAPSIWAAQRSVPDAAVHGTVRNPLVWMFVVLIPLIGTVPQTILLLSSDVSAYDSISPLIFLITFVHAVLLFYMFHILTEDLWRHEVEWTDFAHGVRVSLAAAGITAGMIEVWPPQAKRSTGLYVVLSFITMGLFVFYWWYVLMKDPAEHYTKQARFEDQLLQLVSRGV